MRSIKLMALLLTSVLPGLGAMGLSGYYLFPDWVQLDQSHRQYQTLAAQGQGIRELSIAQAAETRHRLNCFAEGVGVLLGGIIFSIGVHGLCTLPKAHE
jgi:hypothetical protein